MPRLKGKLSEWSTSSPYTQQVQTMGVPLVTLFVLHCTAHLHHRSPLVHIRSVLPCTLSCCSRDVQSRSRSCASAKVATHERDVTSPVTSARHLPVARFPFGGPVWSTTFSVRVVFESIRVVLTGSFKRLPLVLIRFESSAWVDRNYNNGRAQSSQISFSAADAVLCCRRL